MTEIQNTQEKLRLGVGKRLSGVGWDLNPGPPFSPILSTTYLEIRRDCCIGRGAEDPEHEPIAPRVLHVDSCSKGGVKLQVREGPGLREDTQPIGAVEDPTPESWLSLCRGLNAAQQLSVPSGQHKTIGPLCGFRGTLPTLGRRCASLITN
jgi:hypothetical protein